MDRPAEVQSPPLRDNAVSTIRNQLQILHAAEAMAGTRERVILDRDEWDRIVELGHQAIALALGETESPIPLGTVGSFSPPEVLQDRITALESFGHQVFIDPESTPRSIYLVAARDAVAPVTCPNDSCCGREIAQAWLDECPHCEAPLHEQPDGVR